MQTAKAIVSKSEFAVLSNVTPSRVSQWICSSQITRASLVGTGRSARIDVAKAHADLLAARDESMVRDRPSGQTTLQAPVPAERIKGQPLPDPAEYRDRADLDDFARGALYAAHAIAHSIPCLLACELKEAGCSDEAAVSVYARHSGEHAGFLVSDALCALGLATEAEMEPGCQHPLAPTHFAGFNPSGRWG